jgi:hypothetical protein
MYHLVSCPPFVDFKWNDPLSILLTHALQLTEQTLLLVEAILFGRVEYIFDVLRLGIIRIHNTLVEIPFADLLMEFVQGILDLRLHF